MNKEKLTATEELKKLAESKKIIALNVFHTVHENNMSITDAIETDWRVDVNKANKADLILAMDQGKVIGIFEKTSDWKKITRGHKKGRGEVEVKDISNNYKEIKGADVKEAFGKRSSNPAIYSE